jgi:hypothetical protein
MMKLTLDCIDWKRNEDQLIDFKEGMWKSYHISEIR